MPKPDLINDFLKTDLSEKKMEIIEILDNFREQTKIEKVKEESFVVNEIVRGTSLVDICENLNIKHPDYKFLPDDIKKFLDRNREIVRSLEKEKNMMVRRHLSAVTQIEEEMTGLYLFTKDLLKKFEAQGDNTSTLGAVNALNKTLINYAKLKGFGGFAQKEASHTNIEINVGEKRNAKTLEANFKLVKDKDVKDGEVSKE